MISQNGGMKMKKRFSTIVLSGLLAASAVFNSAAAVERNAVGESLLISEEAEAGSWTEEDNLEMGSEPEEIAASEESAPSDEESASEESAPSEEESELEESAPSEEESESEESAPSDEESQPEESAPSREESEAGESAPAEEETNPEESIPSAENSLVQGSVPSAENSEPKQKAEAIGFQDFDVYGSEPYITLTYDVWERQLPEFPETVTLMMDDGSTREIEAIWVTEDEFADAELETYIYTLELPKGIQFEEELAQEIEENQAMLPWIELVPEAGIATYAVGNPDLSSFSFSISDIRTPSKEMEFDGGNGKNAVLIFGGLSSCGNTESTIRAFQSVLKSVGTRQLDVYAFDIKNNSDSAIISWLPSLKISEDICVNSIKASSDYRSLYRYCLSSLGLSSIAMPLVVYKNADGEVYTYSTGNVDAVDIRNALEEGGITAEQSSGDYTVTISGQSLYSEAFDVLELVNQNRENNGLPALVMDKDLLDAAMTRAAECAVFYSHTRPNGLSCFSIIDTMHEENIAAGQYDAADVMNSWMNSTGHRTNILADCHQSIGIGCFRYNNRNYWVQVFGDSLEQRASQLSDRTQTYDVETASDYVEIGFSTDEKEMHVGDSSQLWIYAVSETNSIAISPSAYRWSSNDSAVARVDSQGKVTAVSKGTTTIVARHQGNSDETLEIRIIVEENPGPEINKIVNTVSGVHVYWDKQTGASRYYVYRSTSREGTYTKIEDLTATNYTDTKVKSGTTYYYKVSAIKDGRETGKSEAMGIAFVDTPDLTLRVNRSIGIGLGWNRIEGATGYAIYRKTTGNWMRVATIAGNNILTWNDTAVKSKNGTEYHYTIRALAGSDMKTLSGCRSTGRTMVRLFTPTISSAAKAGATSLKATWNRNSAATGYEVRLMVGSAVYKTYTYGNNTIIAKTITGLPKGKTYKVQVRSYKKVTGVGSFYSAWSAAKNVTL